MRRDEEGLTLVELLVVTLIMGVVGGITVTGLVQGMRTSDRVEARVQAVTSLQQAAERVARDLRRGIWTDISVDPLPAPPAGCTYISLDGEDLTLIVFDGADRYRHQYTLVGTALELDIDRWDLGTSAWVDERDTTVIDGLANATTLDPVFGYLDTSGDDLLDDGFQADDRSKVRTFTLTLVADIPDQDTVDVTTTVTARNGGLTCPVAL